MIRVAIADDQALVRAGFRMLLESASDIEVVGEAANGDDAIALAQRSAPEVFLMDVRMPGTDGIAATERICGPDSSLATRVLILTTFDLDEHVHAALRAGASGFLLKDTPPAELLEAIRVVASGDALLAPTVTRRLIEAFVRQAPREDAAAPADLDLLTNREREILVLVARGMSNAELAEELFVGIATVKTHVSRLLMKLHVRDRAQLVVAAYESGLVTPGS